MSKDEKMVDSIHLVEGWLIMITILGGILFALSYFEDQQEAQEKHELEERLLLIEEQINTLNKTSGEKR